MTQVKHFLTGVFIFAFMFSPSFGLFAEEVVENNNNSKGIENVGQAASSTDQTDDEESDDLATTTFEIEIEETLNLLDTGSSTEEEQDEEETVVEKEKGEFLLAQETATTTEDAEEAISIWLQIETDTGRIFNGEIDVNPCPDYNGATTTSITAFCAVEQTGLEAEWTWWGEDAFVESIDGVSNDFANNKYWLWFSDLELGDVAMNKHTLSEDEEVLLTYNINPLKLQSSDDILTLGTTTTISVLEFGFDDSFNAVWTPAASSTLKIDGGEFEAPNGNYEFVPTGTSTVTFQGFKSGYLPSKELALGVQEPDPSQEEPTLNISLQVVAATSTLFHESIEVSACPDYDGATTTSITAYCAVERAELGIAWNWFGEDAFLESIGGVANDFSSSKFWLWFSDLEIGDVAMNKFLLDEGDQILITYDAMPLRVNSATTTPAVGTSTEIFVEEFGFDDSFNAVWTSAASSTLHINDGSFFLVEGLYELIPTSTSTLTLWGNKIGFVQSPETTLSPQEQEDNQEEDTSDTGGPDNEDSGQKEGKLNVDKALEFLQTNQRSDGSFGSDLYTDWAALAIDEAPNDLGMRSKIRNYLLSHNPNLQSTTDHERHAIALMALGINPYSGTDANYIQEITDNFDGEQIGDNGLVNDDIFALFPLLKAGYDESDEIIKAAVSFILSRQGSNGAWESPDLTAAAIQALSEVSSLPGVSSAIGKARGRLKNIQNTNCSFGSFGNGFTTSWVIQAIVALGENVNSWGKDGCTPHSYLTSLQQDDGGIGTTTLGSDTRVWATSYAVTAAMEKTWASLMEGFSKQEIESENDTENASTESEDDETATSTPEDIPEVLGASTTTPETNDEPENQDDDLVYTFANNNSPQEITSSSPAKTETDENYDISTSTPSATAKNILSPEEPVEQTADTDTNTPVKIIIIALVVLLLGGSYYFLPKLKK